MGTHKEEDKGKGREIRRRWKGKGGGEKKGWANEEGERVEGGEKLPYGPLHLFSTIFKK